MTLDERVRDALHATYGQERPAADLESRLVAALAARQCRPRPWLSLPLRPTRVGAALAAVAVVAMVAMVMPLALSTRSGSGPAGSSATVSKQTPWSSPVVTRGHFAGYGLAFDFPADWYVDATRVETPSGAFLVVLGNAPVTNACVAITPKPSPPAAGVLCGPTRVLEPGQVIVEISVENSDQATLAGSGFSPDPWTALLRSGVRFQLGEDLSKVTDLAGPPYYVIAAYFKGPGTEQMCAQVDALVDSLTGTHTEGPNPGISPTGESATPSAYCR